MRAKAAAALFTTVSLLAFAPAAHGAAGEPDSSFGNNGFTVLDDPGGKNEFLEDLLVLPDGKILGAGARNGAGGFLLARFNSDGTPDVGFGNEGIKVEPDLGMSGNPRAIYGIEERNDGKFVVAGLGHAPTTLNDAYEFGRYLPNGELDPGFGTGGLTTVPINEHGSPRAMTQAPDGKLVATGDAGPEEKASVVRVTEEGEADTSFNAVPAGVRLVDVPGSPHEEGSAIDVLGNGTVLIGGWAETGAFMAELDANGNPVEGFGTAGIAVHDLGTAAEPSGEFFDLKVLADGRILATGASVAGPNDEEAFVARFTPNGELDPSFANGGVFLTNPTPRDDLLTSLEVLPDGRILAAGILDGGTGTGDTWLLRLTPQGQLDGGFGSGGQEVASAAPGEDGAFGLALQPDGRAVVVGDAAGPEAFTELLVGRFTADPTPINEAAKPRCAGQAATIVGTKRRDRLNGTRRKDVIVALGGNDRIASGSGNDLICAGTGKDTVKAGKGRDKVRGEAGADNLSGGPGNDTLLGEAGSDRLFGEAGKDVCNGGSAEHDKAARSCERRRQIP